jgi:2-dehydro-3-deoxygluconokinase
MDLFTNNKGTVLSFGELLLRICPDAGGRWLNENLLPFYVGGAELNVATALALWGIPSQYFTALPDNGMSRQILGFLKTKNVDVPNVCFSGNRLGLYFLTQGKDLKHDALIYDRANSSFSELKPGTIGWDKVFDGVTWFHFSTICPAINQNIADICLEALEAASQKGITVSIDLNYRSKLWQYGSQPKTVIPQLMPYCDLIMGNIWAAELMLDIPVVANIHQKGSKTVYLDAALNTSVEIMRRYPKCRAVANTFRFDQGESLKYYTTIYDGSELIQSREYTATDIVDKVGSGDCYMAGLIYGYYNKWATQTILEFSTAAAFDKLFIKSDATINTVEHIKKVMKHVQ